MAFTIDIGLESIGPVAPSLPAAGVSTQPSSTGGAPLVNEQESANLVGDVVAGGTHDGVSAAYSEATREVSLTNTDKGTVAVAAHVALLDPHPQYHTAAEVAADIATHSAAVDPHGDRAFATAADAAHVAATDPHGDRAYADSQDSLKVAKAGDTMTGDLVVNAKLGIGRTPVFAIDAQAATGSTVIRARSPTAGADSGAAFVFTGGNDTTIGGFGEYSGIYGGAFQDKATIYAKGALDIGSGGTPGRISILSDGKVGIGTTSVYNQVSLPRGVYLGWNGAGGASDNVGVKGTDGIFSVYAGAPDLLTVSSLAITGAVPFEGTFKGMLDGRYWLGDYLPTGRSVIGSGVYTATSLGDAVAPTTYGAVLGFGAGAVGSAEFFAGWNTGGYAGGGVWYRTLRDTTDSWTPWAKLLDSVNVSAYALPITGGTLTGDLIRGGTPASSGTISVTVGESGSGSAIGLLRTGSAYSYAGALSNEGWLYNQGNLNVGPDGAYSIKFLTNGSKRMEVTPSGTVSIGGGFTDLTGDLGVARPSAPATGVVFFGNVTGKYLYYDGTNFNLVGGDLKVPTSAQIGSDASGGVFVQRCVSGWEDILQVYRGGGLSWSLKDIGGIANLTTGLRLPAATGYSAVTGLVDGSSKLRTGTTEVTAGVTTYIPAISSTSVITSQGYQGHMNIGHYRYGSSSWAGGVYLAFGGNDLYPTSAWHLDMNGTITAPAAASVTIANGLVISGGVYATGGVSSDAAVAAQRFYTGFDSGVANSISCSNWVRLPVNTGMFWPGTGTGVQSPQGTYGSFGTYGAKGDFHGVEVNGQKRMCLMSYTAGADRGLYQETGTAAWLFNYDGSNNVAFPANITAVGSITSISDARRKTDIAPLRGALDKLLQITGVSYTMREDGKAGVGVIAQDVQAVYPELVEEQEPARLPGVEGPVQPVLSVAYGNLVGPIIEALREIDARLRVIEATLQPQETV